MPAAPALDSWAPNATDVVLWRALHGVAAGRCLDLTGDGLTTRALVEAGWTRGSTGDDPLHVLVVDAQDLATALVGISPWVVVVRTAEGAPRPAAPGAYAHVLFDGVDHLLVHDDHAELAPALGHAACVRDAFTTAAQRTREADLARWRARAVEGWQEQTASPLLARTLQEPRETRESVSWRVTRPLRSVRTRVPPRG